jgi:leucyl/phenylalanyl-tRNA--protein transferase
LPAFTADDLLDCYRRGVFPMADSRRDATMFLVDPARRGVIPLDTFRPSRRLARTLRSDRFVVTANRNFLAVIEACAAPGPNRPETWINGAIQDLCVDLHRRGMAHSVEAWLDGALAGGLYGIAIGGAFFGESMFSLQRDASKVALSHLVARLRLGGFTLLDAQFLTDHLGRLGAEEISREAYRKRLTAALASAGDFAAAAAQLTGAEALQVTSHAS